MPIDYVGKTALITGASSGIGEQFAMALAARGANLILVARRTDRLAALASQIESSTKSKVTTITLDLSTPSSPSELVKVLAEKNATIDVLINNAGFGTNLRLQNQDLSRIRQEIGLNVATLTELTASYLPQMIARDSGIIINIASTAAYQAVPGMSVYGATKAYVLSFTEALWGELRGTNVLALAVSPGATATEFFEVATGSAVTGSGANMAPATDVVQGAMVELDKPHPAPSIIIGSRNRMMASATKFVARKRVIALVASMFLKER
jgi:short-subunit dehydrogenase